jgi:hypothetical protein
MIIAIFSRGMVTNLTTTAYTPRPPDLYPKRAASNADSGIATPDLYPYPNRDASNADSGIAGNSVLGAVGGEEMTPAATAAPAIAPPAARLPGRWTPRDAMGVVDDYCVAVFGLAPALRWRHCADGEITAEKFGTPEIPEETSSGERLGAAGRG